MTERTEKLVSRRQALRRLGLGVATAYIAPSLTTLSVAQAKSSPTEPSEPSDPTAPTPPSEPTAPSQPTTPTGPSGSVSSDGGNTNTVSSPSSVESASCRARVMDDNSFSISRKDYDAAQAAVRAGNALPLDSVWPEVAKQYNGRLIGIEFAGSGNNAQYQFRAISASGRLETIVVRASSGLIDSIVGC